MIFVCIFTSLSLWFVSCYIGVGTRRDFNNKANV